MSETISDGIKNLKKRISDANIPASSKNNFRLLTWNIRNLNKDKEDRAITYITEVMKNFDIIAIQECKKSLGGLEKLQKALGKHYRFLFSDVGGNSERLVFCYDNNKVEFTGLAAEVVMAPGAGRDKVKPELEFDRTPYMASFRVNGCNFIITTVHIYYGSGDAVKYRKQEIANIAIQLKKSSGDTDVLDTDYILCGDFNIEDVRSKLKKPGKEDPLEGLFDALLAGGIHVPDDIRNSPSNLSKTKHFDQIGFYKYKDSTITFEKGGVIDFVGAVYIGDKKLSYKLTDHLPMWAVFSVTKDMNPKFINP
jgi:exonuclease III